MILQDGEKRRDAGTLLFLALVPTILFADIFFGRNTLYLRDVALYHYPGKRILREIVLGGEFPYWSPYISAGQPLAANPVHQVFYPPTWLILLPDFTTGFNLLALIHVYLAMFGMYALLRSMRPGDSPTNQRYRAAAAFGGLSFGIGGLMVSLLNLFPLLYTAAWLPVTCLFTRRFLITRRRRDFAWAALSLAMQLLVGEPVTALQTGIILGAYAMHRGWSDGRGRGAARAVAMVGAISLTALLLASVQIIPAVDHLRDSGRGRGIDFFELTEWSTPPLRLLEPLFPAILGRWMLGNTSVFPSAELLRTAQPTALSQHLRRPCSGRVCAGGTAGPDARRSPVRVPRAALRHSHARRAHAAVSHPVRNRCAALRPFSREVPDHGRVRRGGVLRVRAGALARTATRAFAGCSLAVAATISLAALCGCRGGVAAGVRIAAAASLHIVEPAEKIYDMVGLSQKEWLFAAVARRVALRAHRKRDARTPAGLAGALFRFCADRSVAAGAGDRPAVFAIVPGRRTAHGARLSGQPRGLPHLSARRLGSRGAPGAAGRAAG